MGDIIKLGEKTVLTRIQLIQVLQSKVPINVYGIPEGVYRPDLLPDSFELASFDAPDILAEERKDHALAPQDLQDPQDPQDNHTDTAPNASNGVADTDLKPIAVIGVGDAGPDQSASDELQPETGISKDATMLEGNHPLALELAGIIDPQQSILERLPDPQPLAEAKAELDGSDVISTFASTFASRGESPSSAIVLPDSGNGNGNGDPDESHVNLPEDSETARASAPSGAPEAVDPPANGQTSHPMSVDLMQFRHAFVPIVFAEGFPAFPDGRPIWLRTDYEPEDVHRLFEQYLMMGQAGVRQLYLLEDIGPYKLGELQEFFHLYSWSTRMKAHDIFRVAEFKNIQANRAIELEDDHFIKAQRLFDKAMMYMETEEFLGQLTPKTAIDLLKTVVAIQRISVGLPSNAPASKDGSNRTELEAVMRTFTDGSKVSNGSGVDKDGTIHGDILADPEATHLAQELIIRMTTHKDSV